MTQYPQYLRYLEEAKRAEVADGLRSEGFLVETEKEAGDLRFDLFAQKNGKGMVYEFKSVGSKRLNREAMIKLQQSARDSGYEFHIVIVNPPPRVKIEVASLRSELLSYALNNRIESFESLSTYVQIERIDSLEISDVHLGNMGTKVSGTGTIEVSLHYESVSDGISSLSDSYPFDFAVSLETDNSLASVDRFDVDTSSFFE